MVRSLWVWVLPFITARVGVITLIILLTDIIALITHTTATITDITITDAPCACHEAGVTPVYGKARDWE